MNLNPLKKDDNTDALVKALEDANSTTDQAAPAGSMPNGDPNPVVSSASSTPTAPADNAAAIAADPQVASAGATADATSTPVASADDATTPATSQPPASGSMLPPVNDALATDQPPVPGSTLDPSMTTSKPDTDASSSDTEDSNDLPGGISSDADAHLTTMSHDSGELDGVKNSALEQLRPLIEKLELEPADKFDKYLMMLRASDDPALIKPAFDAAQGITGEKEKAQALLDIINEINYITSQKS